jgi:hypothetical protein
MVSALFFLIQSLASAAPRHTKPHWFLLNHEHQSFAMTDPIPPPASTIVLLNIHSHVPVTLNATNDNFWKWGSFFELTFKKFGLVNHVDGTVNAAAMIDDPEWLQIDSCIVSLALLHRI